MKLSPPHFHKHKYSLHNPHLKSLRARLELLCHNTTSALPVLVRLVRHYRKAATQIFKSNQCCYLCSCQSREQICHWCVDDMPDLSAHIAEQNLLNSPVISDAITHDNFEQMFIPLLYQWPITRVLKDFKYTQKTWLVGSLNYILTRHLVTAYSEVARPEAIIPVPIHYKKYAQRMYNQAALLAQEVGLTLSIPVLLQQVARTRNTPAQSLLTGTQRRKNAISAFSCGDMQPWQHVAIVDDVVTTGATVDALACTLKKSNPKLKIDVWAVALSI